MKRVLLATVVVLSGCAATETRYVDRVVNNAIPVKCEAEKPVRPVMPTEVLPENATEFEVVRAALAEIDIRDGYEGLLVAALDQCLRAPTAVGSEQAGSAGSQ